MSAGSHTVEIMNANTPPAAPPPQPGSVEHWAAWLDRYGDDYVDRFGSTWRTRIYAYQ